MIIIIIIIKQFLPTEEGRSMQNNMMYVAAVVITVGENRLKNFRYNNYFFCCVDHLVIGSGTLLLLPLHIDRQSSQHEVDLPARTCVPNRRLTRSPPRPGKILHLVEAYEASREERALLITGAARLGYMFKILADHHGTDPTF